MKIIKLNQRKKYGKSSDKALSFQELDFLRYHIEDIKEKTILIGTAFSGMRISELVQCRLSWLRWDILENRNGKKLRVLAIDIPGETKDIFNKYRLWSPKTKKSRTTYILDETLAESFKLFYETYPDGISKLFKSKNMKSIIRNISIYTIGIKFLSYLHQYHTEELNKTYGSKLSIQEIMKKVFEIRPKLSAHPLRSTYENVLFDRYDVSIDIVARIMGHTVEIAQKHYIANTKENTKNKLANQILK